MIRSPHTNKEWEAYFYLRYQILRAPWGQPEGSEQTADEAQHQHFAFFNEQNQILGTGRLDLLTTQTAQIRFMAVAKAQQGKGIGKSLIEKMESAAKETGCNKMTLHARETALCFYQNLGYQIKQPSHLLFGEIQHFLMHKTLTA